MFKKIKNNLKKIVNNELYSPKQITDLGLIVNTEIKPSIFTIYRLIKTGQIKTVNLSTGKLPQYRIKGKDLKEFVEKRYKL